MSKIRGRDLIKLDFKKNFETALSIPEENFHYYTYEVNRHCVLISCSNDECKSDGGYYVEFYEIPEIRFTDLEDLKKLIELLKNGSYDA
jgi:hypothetical protein